MHSQEYIASEYVTKDSRTQMISQFQMIKNPMKIKGRGAITLFSSQKKVNYHALF